MMIDQYNNEHIQKDLEEVVSRIGDWNWLNGKSILVTGATGMIASYFTYVLIYLKEHKNIDIEIYLLFRNKKKGEKIFSDNGTENLIIQDICDPINLDKKFDYVFHAAGPASAFQIKHYPTELIKTNLYGTLNVLEYLKRTHFGKLLFTSTREVYGSVEKRNHISEDDIGVLDPLNVRSCYPESKRMAENLLVSYEAEYKVPYNVFRIAHVYGPGMSLENDGRVMSDFISDAVYGRDIVINSDGSAQRAFCYITDAIAAFFCILQKGEENEVYNIANETEEISILSLAKQIVEISGKSINVLVKGLAVDPKSYTTFKRTSLDTSKLRSLGWQPEVTLYEGLKRSLKYYRK